jgi:hypothetical protein
MLPRRRSGLGRSFLGDRVRIVSRAWRRRARPVRGSQPPELAPKPDFDGKQGRQDSNLQPPVLETGALPIELRPSGLRERFYRRAF